MFKFDKEKVKDFFEEHGFEVFLSVAVAIGTGLITGACVRGEAERTAAYKDMCTESIRIMGEKAAKNEPVKVVITKAIEEACGTGV